MRIGLGAWSFTASHREAGLSPDPFRPEALAELARSRGLHSVEGASGWFSGWRSSELAAYLDSLVAPLARVVARAPRAHRAASARRGGLQRPGGTAQLLDRLPDRS